MNTVTYTRLSVEGDNVETQLRDCHKLAADRGWTITEDYQDNGISAFKRTSKRAGPKKTREEMLVILRANSAVRCAQAASGEVGAGGQQRGNLRTVAAR